MVRKRPSAARRLAYRATLTPFPLTMKANVPAAEALLLTASDRPTLDVLGIDHTVLVSRDDTDGSYELVEIAGDPGPGVPPHVHQHEDETFYVLEGRVTFTVHGEETEATAGTVVHLPHGVPHGFRLGGVAHCRMLLTIAPAGLGPMFEELAALADGGPPDPEEAAAVVERYGIRFV